MSSEKYTSQYIKSENEPGRATLRTKVYRLLLPLLVLAVGIGAATVVVKSKPEVTDDNASIELRTVRTVVVSPQARNITVQAQGTVEPRQQINIIPQVSGEITWVADNFVNGGKFSPGELIMQMDPRDYELAVTSAEATVADAIQQLETAKAQSEQAAADWQLLDRQAPTALALRKPQLAGAEARLKSAQAELQRARLMLERTGIYAPYTGMISNKNVDFGQYITAGSQLASFSSTDVLEIRLSVPERELINIELDKLQENIALPVRITNISAKSELIWQGRIVRTEGAIDPRTRNFTVVAQFTGEELISENGMAALSIGQFVRAEIQGRIFSEVYEIPRIALHNGESVYVVDGNNRLQVRSVNILEINETSVLIADSLKEGEQVSVSPLTSSAVGQQVIIQNANTEDSVAVANGVIKS